MPRVKNRQKTEFGDFQTPIDLARDVCARLAQDGISPASVLEPTCGKGTFLQAAAEFFPDRPRLIGREANPLYVATAQARFSATAAQVDMGQVDIREADFFQVDWPRLLAQLPQPLLVLGNPPWVTNSQLGTFEGTNLPAKSNFLNETGLDARTGKANFDISQWMIERLIDNMVGTQATLAMLCKTAVARKVLRHIWKRSLPAGRSSIRQIDARRHFGAAVDACLFTWTFSADAMPECEVFVDLQSEKPSHFLGWHEGSLLANQAAFRRHQHLRASNRTTRWRSGIKHDCRAVMQLRRDGSKLLNGLGEIVIIEPEYLFPLLPAGAIFRGEVDRTDRFLVVPQTHTGEDTTQLRKTATGTWAYLSSHATRLAARKSSIYRGRPPFSIFGVGPYSFAPWKVAISALHKQLAFRLIGPLEGRPVMLDDTTYFLSFENQREAQAAVDRLNSAEVREFYSAWIFWDAKRPITAEILQRLS